jgi:hypothetical protein
VNRIDDTTAFLVAANSDQDMQIGNENGVEINTGLGVHTYNGKFYTSGTYTYGSSNIAKYRLEGKIFTKEGEFSAGERGQAGSIMFVDDSKAYVPLLNQPELLIFNPTTMEITGSIDLSAYALGEGDTNPNASTGVIRDGKFFLGLAQFDTTSTVYCQGGASVLVIDVATDVIEKHIQDDRACMTGWILKEDVFVDELGDIYVNNMAAFGFYPDFKAGYLRIKAGETEFDPDYFFSITDLDLPEVPGGKVTWLWGGVYAGDGIVYGNLWVPALSSNPPDYVNDKNFLAYKLDLRNQMVTAVDVPPTTGFSALQTMYDDKVLFGRTTDAG